MVAFHLDPETGRYNNARLSGAIDEIAGPIMTRSWNCVKISRPSQSATHNKPPVAAGKLQEADDLTARLRETRRRGVRRSPLHCWPARGCL